MKTRRLPLIPCSLVVVIGYLCIMVTSAWSAAPTYLIAIGNNSGTANEVELLYAQRDARQITRVFQELGEVSGKTAMLLA